ncbi:MAG: hypothetical protein ACREF9_07610 [Opitutaceae bacterium]
MRCIRDHQRTTGLDTLDCDQLAIVQPSPFDAPAVRLELEPVAGCDFDVGAFHDCETVSVAITHRGTPAIRDDDYAAIICARDLAHLAFFAATVAFQEKCGLAGLVEPCVSFLRLPQSR